ncbi:ATP-binding protein [Streptomyces sp. NBC_00878]|uniref:ATP-binding protein n=1 Tax=Streptomyces sp. NBC_00878 TaxID=2975854 RepID=UPI002251CCDC|nr:ATP-binding protein [Streptomyces sp. NBC_00878]MCX4905770.1 ATP-binding protein [Streptomyces sp. NBC_00878]
MPISLCTVQGDHSAPAPEPLAYSLTLPATLRSPAIARAATRTVLVAHGLGALADPAEQAVGELVAVACRFTPTSEVYLSLRHRDGALRVIVYDGHPRHTHPRLAAACDTRRRASLRLLGCVVRACEGDWGFGEAREPGGGTRMWAVLPCGGTPAGVGDPPEPMSRSM